MDNQNYLKCNIDINISESSGFCFGVRRADKIVNELSQTNSKVFILGELIHNNDYIKSLSDKSIVTLEGIDDVTMALQQQIDDLIALLG